MGIGINFEGDEDESMNDARVRKTNEDLITIINAKSADTIKLLYAKNLIKEALKWRGLNPDVRERLEKFIEDS